MKNNLSSKKNTFPGKNRALPNDDDIITIRGCTLKKLTTIVTANPQVQLLLQPDGTGVGDSRTAAIANLFRWYHFSYVKFTLFRVGTDNYAASYTSGTNTAPNTLSEVLACPHVVNAYSSKLTPTVMSLNNKQLTSLVYWHGTETYGDPEIETQGTLTVSTYDSTLLAVASSLYVQINYILELKGRLTSAMTESRVLNFASRLKKQRIATSDVAESKDDQEDGEPFVELGRQVRSLVAKKK